MSRLQGLCGNGIRWDGHWCSGEERVLRFCLEESVCKQPEVLYFASAKSGAWPRLADGLVPLSGALRELFFEREEEGGVQRGEAVCLRFRVAFVVVFVERVVGLGFCITHITPL